MADSIAGFPITNFFLKIVGELIELNLSYYHCSVIIGEILPYIIMSALIHPFATGKRRSSYKF